MAQKKNHYVNNPDLYKAMVEWKKECSDKGEIVPISQYIGECILEIANRLSTKPNFMNYTYKEEMIMDGVENCILYMHNFKPEKYKNPFAYFTQIIYYAFLRRIDKEKKQTDIKNKMIKSMSIDALGVDGDDDNIDSTYISNIQRLYPDGDRDAKNKSKYLKAKKKKGLENFYEDNTNN